MVTASREDALVWGAKHIGTWPCTVNDIVFGLQTPEGWHFSLPPGESLYTLQALGRCSISMIDWMSARGQKAPSREEAMDWVLQHFNTWPTSEDNEAPDGWVWRRLVRPNSVTLMAGGRMCIQERDWDAMRAVHVDDMMQTETAVENAESLGESNPNERNK